MKKVVSHKFWITGENGFMLGQGRVALLEAIINEGSISKAAKSLNMSYKKAWRLINGLNTTSEKPIVIRLSGGVGGGGTTVTEEGKRLIESYKAMHERASKYFKEESENFSL